jgi:hypothetical protein
MDIQTAVEGIEDMLLGRPKEGASLQAQSHKVEEGKGSYLDSAGNLGMAVAVAAGSSG